MDDLTGKVFGKRTVLQRVEKTASREWSYLCRCVCGKEDVVRGSSLRAGKSHQCHACSAAETKNRTSHGLSKTPIYQSWKAMLHRCSVPTDPNYANYGGRGIYVCSAWLNAENFYEWSVNNGWDKGLSIDRIDVNAGYSPENCRWATSSQQRENVQLITRSNKSGYRGVSKKHERDCWIARITVSGKITHLGHHKTALEAALAHDKYIHDNGLVRPMNFQNPYEVEAREAEMNYYDIGNIPVIPVISQQMVGVASSASSSTNSMQRSTYAISLSKETSTLRVYVSPVADFQNTDTIYGSVTYLI